jgi:glycosidase
VPGLLPLRRDALTALGREPDLTTPAGARKAALVLRRAQTPEHPAAGEGSGNGDARLAEAGDVLGAALLHAAFDRVAGRYLERVDGAAWDRAITAVDERLGTEAVDRVLDAARATFAIGDDRRDALFAVAGAWLANANPALRPLRPLIADDEVRAAGGETLIAALAGHFNGRPPFGPDRLPLPAMLRSPAVAVPDSLAGQLEYVRERWAELLGDLLARLLLGLDVLDEEARGRWARFHPSAGGGRGPGFGGGAFGEALGGLAGEAEAFSADSAWMPRVVLMAKSTYVWLDQLSRWYGREIRTLDGVPDEELDRLVSFGVSGLWLIGLWQRSRASEEIKRRRGNAEAVASAYSLDDYRIADDLGGEGAWGNLRERAAARGLRLASDMVPNHMGVDSRWVIEHPERFLSLDEPPYPSYTFDGPDLSPDPRVRIAIEDHYWDATDAAVVFLREDRSTGERRFIYHGNDGTSFPWNDTAQLNYLDGATREAVIRTILDVARRFPIIRFDAAMTLARRHVRRLWWPEPGAGGSIPSRAEHAISQADFNRAMPKEFWREVVDRVAAEAPDTLLLAEAFWLMEGYFVRTLGMHRVYNSAFMHMLRDEDNAGYRRVMRDTLEFDPEILKRYVNFMTNPDEQTAVEQFGKGDKYFGIATMLATLPGLPLLGHGQLEGFAEKYGMEYRRAYRQETVDEGLLAHHVRTIVPLLHRRAQFAEVRDFLLYDVTADDGSHLDDVFAYSNVGPRGERSLVVYHNRFGAASGWIRDSVPFSVPNEGGGRSVARRTLADGWRLPEGGDAFVLWRDDASGLEYLAPADELRGRGLRIDLQAYERRVLLDVRGVRDGSARLWSRLWERIGSRGVPSLDDALRELALEPIHEPLRAAIVDGLAPLIRTGGAPDERALEAATARAVAAIAAATSTGRRAEDVTRVIVERARDLASRARPTALGGHAGHDRQPSPVTAAFGDRWHRAVLAGWLLTAPLGRLAPGDPVATSRAWFDELRLEQPLVAGLRSTGVDEGGAWSASARVRLLLDLPRPSTVGGRSRPESARRLVTAWLDRPDLRGFLGVNRWDGVEWFSREKWRELLDWSLLLDELVSTDAAQAARSRAVVVALADAGERSAYRLDSLLAAIAPRRPSVPPPGRRADRSRSSSPARRRTS